MTKDEFTEDIDLTVEPWRTLAVNCWNEPSPHRLGQQAELTSTAGNPFTKPSTRALFDRGRAVIRNMKGQKP